MIYNTSTTKEQLPISVTLKEDAYSGDEFIPWYGWASSNPKVLSNKDADNQIEPKKQKRLPISRPRLKGNFPCDKCGRTYMRKDSLQRHVQWECGIEPQFQCPFCPQKSKRKAHQIRHIQRQHKDLIGMLDENNADFDMLKKH